MGAAASHKEDKAARARAIRAKIKAVAALSKANAAMADNKEKELQEVQAEGTELSEPPEEENTAACEFKEPCEISPEEPCEEDEISFVDGVEDVENGEEGEDCDKIEDAANESNEGEDTEKEKKPSKSRAFRKRIRALASLTPNLSMYWKSVPKERNAGKKTEETSSLEIQESKGEELDFDKRSETGQLVGIREGM